MRSERRPKTSLSTAESASATPSMSPIIQAEPPSPPSTSEGMSGKIISLEASVSRLVRPSSTTTRGKRERGAVVVVTRPATKNDLGGRGDASVGAASAQEVIERDAADLRRGERRRAHHRQVRLAKH